VTGPAITVPEPSMATYSTPPGPAFEMPLKVVILSAWLGGRSKSARSVLGSTTEPASTIVWYSFSLMFAA
jgi:hypothetical protein